MGPPPGVPSQPPLPPGAMPPGAMPPGAMPPGAVLASSTSPVHSPSRPPTAPPPPGAQSRPKPVGSVPIKPPPAATSDAAPPGPTDDQAAAGGRTSDARLARVHLRGGLLPLARAALEQMAGAGTLDPDSMADLAEVRWRGGDLEGAADAARAHQVSGGTEPLAALILAEDLARTGQDGDARDLAQSVYDRVGGAVDVLFAMEPRSSIWPTPDGGWMTAEAGAPGHWGLLVGGSEVAAPDAETWRLVPVVQPAAPPTVPPIGATAAAAATAVPVGRGGVGQPGGATSTSAVVMSGRLAGKELERVDRSLATGDTQGATQRLGVLLRLDPALAPIILSAADRAASAAAPGSGDLSAIHLVRGDAYRSLGRDIEAAAAYQQAHQALTEGPAPEEST